MLQAATQMLHARACLCVRACVHARAQARVCGVRACVCVLRGAVDGAARALQAVQCGREDGSANRLRSGLGLVDDARGRGDHEELRVHGA